MKSSPEYFQIFSNFYVVLFMILVVIILISINIITTPLGKVLVLFFGKSGDNDILNFNEMGEEEKKLYMITQVNTRINKFFIDQSEHYANTFYQEIYGSPYKFAAPLQRKKEKRSDMRVTFAKNPIILNPST